MHRMRVNAEITCSGTLEEEPRRGAERRCHRVTFVPPRGELAGDGKLPRNAVDRLAAGLLVVEPLDEAHAVLVNDEDVAHPRKPCRARIVEPARIGAFDAKRSIVGAWRREVAGETGAQRGQHGVADHRVIVVGCGDGQDCEAMRGRRNGQSGRIRVR